MWVLITFDVNDYCDNGCDGVILFIKGPYNTEAEALENKTSMFESVFQLEDKQGE